MIKKMIVLGIAGFLATAGMALAQTGDAATAQTTAATIAQPAQQMLLEVGPRGKVLLRGTIDSVSATSLTVKSWGGNWIVNISSGTEVLPKDVALSSFKKGDFVGVQGIVSQSASWTIDATLVRDWTAREMARKEIKQNMQTVREEMKSGTPRNLEGTVSDLNASTKMFTLAEKGGTNYVVSLTPGAQILQKNFVTLDFSKVQNGDTVRVWGPVVSSTISASIFRDLSI
jgi:hypothetical protein